MQCFRAPPLRGRVRRGYSLPSLSFTSTVPGSRTRADDWVYFEAFDPRLPSKLNLTSFENRTFCDGLFNPKRAGLFSLDLKSGGGGAGGIPPPPPPPSDLGRGATKNSEIWHVRRVSQYKRADEIAILKIKAFFNYANLC